MFELEHPLIKEAGIKWVMFYDIGNSFGGVPILDSNGTFGLRQDWGFGIRWFSPLGPLRFEWGFPIGRQTIATKGVLESSPSFIFFIGQPF
jgi:outer membrane protein insertion porin family